MLSHTCCHTISVTLSPSHPPCHTFPVTQSLINHYGLREAANACPQTYALGLKEVWEVPEEVRPFPWGCFGGLGDITTCLIGGGVLLRFVVEVPEEVSELGF